VWFSPWTFVKVLYVLSRYLAFVDVSVMIVYQTRDHKSPRTCQIMYTITAWVAVFGIMIAEVILVVRTWAIWQRSKRVLHCLILASFIFSVPVIVVEKIFLDSLRFVADPNQAKGCSVTTGTPIIAINFTILITFETFLLVFTVLKAVEDYKISNCPGVMSVLYRDGIVFYIYLLAISLINLVVVVATPRGLAEMLAIYQHVLHSCFSGKVLINLREALRRRTRTLSLTDLVSTQLRHVHSESPARVADSTA